MDRQAQDQLDESAGQEMIQRIQELNGINTLFNPMVCDSCGAARSSLQHFVACGAAHGVLPTLNLPLQGESTPRGRYVARFKALQAKMLAITLAKNNDYGGQDDPYKNFRLDGAHGILIRAGDKMSRLRTAIVEKRKFAVDESIEDTCLDLANYALLLLCFLESEGK